MATSLPRAALRVGKRSSLLLASEPDGASALSSPASQCKVCRRKQMRYSCPRCHIGYCSVDCYKSHGSSCTEAFARAHVEDTLAAEAAAAAAEGDDGAALEDMRAMRQRAEEAVPIEGEDADELVRQRLEALLLCDGGPSLDALTEEERSRFHAAVSAGALSRFIELWQPWWLATADEHAAAVRGPLVEVMDEEADTADTDTLPAPAEALSGGNTRPPCITRMEGLQLKRCTELLPAGSDRPVHLVSNVVHSLFCYAALLRHFNGDVRSDVLDATHQLLSLSSVLSRDARFSSVEDAIADATSAAVTAMDGEEAAAAALRSDTVALATSAHFAVDALCDARALFEEAAAQLKRDRTSKGSRSRLHRRFLRAAAAKLYFFACWAADEQSAEEMAAAASCLC